MLSVKLLDGDDELFEFCLPELAEATDLDDYIRRTVCWHGGSECRAMFVEGRGGDLSLRDEVLTLRTKYPLWPGTWVIFDFGDRFLKRDIVCNVGAA